MQRTTNPSPLNNNNNNNNHLANAQAQSTKPKEARIAAAKRAIKKVYGKSQVPYLVVNQSDRELEKAFGTKPMHFSPGNRPEDGEEKDSLKNPERQMWNDLRSDMTQLVNHHIVARPDWMRMIETDTIPALLRVKCINALAHSYPDLFYIKDGQGNMMERFQHHFIIEWLFVDVHSTMMRKPKRELHYDGRKRRDDDYEYLYKTERNQPNKQKQQKENTQRNSSPSDADAEKENTTSDFDKQGQNKDIHGERQMPNLPQQSSGNVGAQPAQVIESRITENTNKDIYNSNAEYGSNGNQQQSYEHINGISQVDVSFMENLLNTPTNSFSLSAPNMQSAGELSASSFRIDDASLPSSQPAPAPASSPLLAHPPSSSQPLLNPDGSFYAPRIRGFHAITPQQSAASLQASRSFAPATLGENTPNNHAVWANIMSGIEHGNPASVPLPFQTPPQASQQEKRANEGIHNGNAQKRTRKQQQQQPPATLPPATAVTSSFTN